jgi:hypothetical protein
VGLAKRRCVLGFELSEESFEMRLSLTLRFCIAGSISSIFSQTSAKEWRACQTKNDTQKNRKYLLLEDLETDLSYDSLKLPLTRLVHFLNLCSLFGKWLRIGVILHDLIEQTDPGTKLPCLEKVSADIQLKFS